MKRWLWLFGLCLMLMGCSAQNRDLSAAMNFREALLGAESCTFQAAVTADYGAFLHGFSMDCRGDRQGKLHFSITSPESIAGIEGTIDADGGNLLFDGEALYFPLLTDDQLIPASAPWILLRSLRAGCITAVGREEALLRVTADDSYEDNALTVDVWLEEDSLPIRGDILYDGKRIMSLEVENFEIS